MILEDWGAQGAGLVRGHPGSRASSCHWGLLERLTAQQRAPHGHKDFLPSLCAGSSCVAATGDFPAVVFPMLISI